PDTYAPYTLSLHDALPIYRGLLVVAIGEHGVERGDRSATGFRVTGTLHQLGQLGEHRRRIALGCRRFADGQGDLALRLGVAGQRDRKSTRLHSSHVKSSYA